MPANPSHSSSTLFRASFQRLTSAWLCWNHGDHALAMYLGGLAVECMLQALAFRAGLVHDARHDLDVWLNKTPNTFIATIRSKKSSIHWNRVVGAWHNNIRYFDRAAILRHLRSLAVWREYRGDDDARMKRSVKDFLAAAEVIHKQGANQWRQSDKS